jgi:hypothetical protein
MISSGSLSNADTSFVDGFSIDDLRIPSTMSGMLTVVMRRRALYFVLVRTCLDKY